MHCVDAKDYDALRRAVTDLCDGCHEELPARESYGRWYHARPDDEPRLRECRLSPSLRKALAAAGTDKAPPGSEAPATEPRGCPTPGACSCAAALAEARREIAALATRLDDLCTAWDAFDEALIEQRAPGQNPRADYDTFHFRETPDAWAKYHAVDRHVGDWQLRGRPAPDGETHSAT